MPMNIGRNNEEQSRIDRLIKFTGDHINGDIVYELQQIGFFVAPASIKYHGAYEGALFDHSFVVANTLVSMTKRLELSWKHERSPYIVGMFHDLCKCDNYIKTDGEWGYNKDILLPGHGEKSVILAQKLLGKLTEEEMLCIRWHMGAFDEKDNWNKYGVACTLYPNVLYTHTADMVAAYVVGV